jgi:protein-tyrosine-phosphatase
MSAPSYILTVCTANICRSPMAAGLLQHALSGQPEPLRSLKVLSAGVAACTGQPVSANSVSAMKKVGIDISGMRSQPLTPKLADGALAIFAMTESHRAMIELNLDPAPENVFLFREFMPGNAHREIADPYGGSLAIYEHCRDEMVEAIPSILAQLRKLIGES